MKGLTEKQRHMLDFIEDFMTSSSMAPTVYEIADHFKIKTSTVFAHLRALQRKGYLTRSSKARSITLNRKSRKQRKTQHRIFALPVPIIEAETKTAAQGNGSDGAKRCELFCDLELLGSHKASEGLFAMRVQGQAFKDAGIFDGDIVVVNPSSDLKTGDIVVTLGNELKRHVQAQGNNLPTEPNGLVAPPSIKGVVVALQRKI